MATIRHFRDLRTWQQCREVRLAVRQLVRTWPAEEKYKLTDQVIRSSRGPTAHVAEGYGRFYEKENIRFCRIARGSLYETQDHLITAQDEGYIDNATFTSHFDLVQEAIKTLNGYMHYLENMSKPTSGNVVSEPPGTYGSTNYEVPPPPSSENPLIADL